jgi:hypothetical protein
MSGLIQNGDVVPDRRRGQAEVLNALLKSVPMGRVGRAKEMLVSWQLRLRPTAE